MVFSHSCAGRNPVDAAFWIPAFAGMTKPRIFFMKLSIILNHRNSKRNTDYVLSYFGHWSLIHWLLACLPCLPQAGAGRDWVIGI
jgi:hypothetical protein